MTKLSPTISLVGKTEFIKPEHIDCDFDAEGGQALVEFAGRACYQSWNKPNSETATNAGYINNIKDHKHFSVLEHGTVSFYIEGISRTLTHELIRHRHFSYSELSQRYVNMRDTESVMHPTIAQFVEDESFKEWLSDINLEIEANANFYEALVMELESRGIRGKKAREAARGYMSANLETKIVVTGNYRAWRHFLAMRASEHADAEIRALALKIFGELKKVAFNIFDDFDYVWSGTLPTSKIIGLHSPYMEIS